MNIYLTGFMGSGKSTIGPLLAKEIGYSFQDLDHLIEEYTGMPIQAYFRYRGEAAFRVLETEFLATSATQEKLVMAVGGGALVRAENLDLAQQHGKVVYLRLTVDQLVERLRRSRQRPLLRDDRNRLLGPDALKERITAMLAQREAYYTRANLIVDAGDLPARDVVKSIIAALGRVPV